MHTQLTFALIYSDHSERHQECWSEAHPQTMELLHLWQFFCPQPELHQTLGREGTTQLLEIGSYCCVLLHSPHSGCHYDSILGSHLAGMVSMTCSEGERGREWQRRIRKVHQGYQQSKLYLFPKCLPSMWCYSQLFYSNWRHGLGLTGWDCGAQHHTVIGTMAYAGAAYSQRVFLSTAH